MFEEGGETSQDFAGSHAIGDLVKLFEGESCFFGSICPDVFDDFFGFEFPFQRFEDLPFERGKRFQFDLGGFDGGIGFFAGGNGPAADVTDAEGEDHFRGHDAKFVGADGAQEKFAMFGERKTLRDFESGPEFIVGASGDRIGGAENDVSTERVLLEHIIEGGIKLFVGNLPRNESPVGEVGGKKRLTYSSDCPGKQHGLDSFDDNGQVNAAAPGDFAERVTMETGELVFRDGEDAGVDGVVDVGRNRGGSHQGKVYHIKTALAFLDFLAIIRACHGTKTIRTEYYEDRARDA